MIDATLPDPTVLPPSRYLNSIFCGIFYTFYCEKQHKIVVFMWCIFICIISWHRFGTSNKIILKNYFVTGAETVPRNYANKNTPHKNNDFMLFFAIKSIENTTKNAIQIP